MDREFLIASTFCFLFGFAQTMFALGRGRYHGSRLNFAAVLAGFLLQTAFLYQRGHAMGHCPLTNQFEVLIFLSWSMVLIYLLVGTAYRLSLLGLFTSPLVFIFQVFAMLAPTDQPSKFMTSSNPWLAMHAAISMVAYGAFALACIAGAMYVVQERLIKRHRIQTFFYELPPIADLSVVVNRLLLVGFVLLTAGLFAVAAGAGKRPEFTGILQIVKAAWPVGVWGIYACILVAKQWRRLSPRRTAILAVLAFGLALSTLWGLNFISDRVHF